jgi:hypothetical protein
MDEMWQRHKSFILQLIVGGVIFLVAFFVMRGMYGDQNDPEVVQKKNAQKKIDLNKKSDELHAPTPSSIGQQKSVADLAEKTKWDFTKRVASVAGLKQKDADRERAYVKESVTWAYQTIGRTDVDTTVGMYDQLPQAALSGLASAIRGSLQGRAAQTGKEIDETLGLGGGFPEEEIPQVMHALAIVSEIAGRCLAKDKIDKVTSIRITPNSRFPEEQDVNFVSGVDVHLEITGDPREVNEVIRSLNAVGKPDRMIVLSSIDGIVPLSTEEDTVKASINVVGLRYKSAAEGN